MSERGFRIYVMIAIVIMGIGLIMFAYLPIANAQQPIGFSVNTTIECERLWHHYGGAAPRHPGFDLLQSFWRIRRRWPCDTTLDTTRVTYAPQIRYKGKLNADTSWGKLTIIHSPKVYDTLSEDGMWIVEDWFNTGKMDSIWVSPGLVPHLGGMVNPWFDAWNPCKYCSTYHPTGRIKP